VISVKYYATREQAQERADRVPHAECVNQYQEVGDSREPKVVQCGKGFAVQFGDCGRYLTKDEA
jgi:hypothetical protein